MSDIGSTGSKSNRDLSENATDAYNRRRQELKENHEQQLKNIQATYEKRQADAAETGKASVNHIKKSTEAQTAEFAKQQASRKEEIVSSVQSDIQQMQETGNKKLRETKARNSSEQDRIESDHKNKTTRLATATLKASRNDSHSYLYSYDLLPAAVK